MNVLEIIGNMGIVPVVVIEDVKNALPTAKAMLAGGVNVMEITLRTKAGLDSIRTVSENCQDMLVGAGTVLTLEQGKKCVEAGAKFIVSPGFDRELVKWCISNNVAVTPGCVTPTEITEAMSLGLNVLKFFPANIYGGLPAMKALAGPFGTVKFIPTGGVNGQNISEYSAASFVHAVGGSWLCDKADINAGNFDKITALCNEARQVLLGFELVYVGINTNNSRESLAVAQKFDNAFGIAINSDSSSHFAIRTNSIPRALVHLAKLGIKVDINTAKYKGDKMIAVYLNDQIGDFAIHLLQK